MKPLGLFCVIIGICLVAGAIILFSSGSREQKDWRELRSEILNSIEQKFEEKRKTIPQVPSLEKLEREVAISEQIPYPVPISEHSAAIVFADAYDEATAQAEERIKSLVKNDEQLLTEAEQKYPLVKKGDKVEFVTHLKANPVVKGTVLGLTLDRVQVNNRWINISDIPSDRRQQFDFPLTIRLRERYVAVEKAMLREKQQELQSEFFKQLLPLRLSANYYRLISDVRPNFKEIKYVAFRDIVQSKAKEQYEEAEAEYNAAVSALKPEITQQLFLEHNFKFYNYCGEWRPASFLRNLRDFF